MKKLLESRGTYISSISMYAVNIKNPVSDFILAIKDLEAYEGEYPKSYNMF
jgi:hypothetical protein